MRDPTEADMTEAVLAELKSTDARFRQVATSLIRHLHAFVREVELTESEWMEAIRFLTAVGQKCDAKRQEFILLSDTLGVSMLVDAINHQKPPGATESTVFGPFYLPGAPELANGANIAEGVAGEPAFFSGRVTDLTGKPIAGAMLDIWGVDGEGWYDVQLPHVKKMQVRGKIKTDAQGGYRFRSVKPVSYSIPTDGPVGTMLAKMGRHPNRPAHEHVMISAPGYKTVITHIFVAGDPYLESDAVFGVKNSLIADFVRHPPGTAPDGSRVDVPYYTINYDFGLEPEMASLNERLR